MVRLLALLLALAVPPVSASVREQGNLVLDGVPPVPEALSERRRAWTELRSAAVADFSPDGGMWITTRFAETPQLHHVAGPGMDRRQLTFFGEPVRGMVRDRLDPSGVYLSMDRGGGEFNQLHWYDFATGRATLLTDGTSKNDHPTTPPDGGPLYFVSTERNGTDFDLWSVERHDPGTRRLVRELQGSWAPAAWSRDGGRLVLQREVSATESELWLLELATGAFREVRPVDGPVRYRGVAFAPDGASLLVATDEGAEFSRLARVALADGALTELVTPAWDVEGVAVSRDGRWLGWVVNEGGRSAVWVAPARRPDRGRRLDLPVGVVQGWRFDDAGERLAVTLSTADTPADVWTVDVRSGRAERWTRSELGGLDPARFVAPTLVETTTFDGRATPAWFWRPPGEARVPVVMVIHGGPEAQTRAAFNPVVQYYVNELGYAVLAPNVRGSTGYGRTYTLLDNGERRFDAVRDIGSWLDWIAGRPDLDRDRVAVTGASYGGFMVLASLVEHGDRLACGVDSVGISNFATFLDHTEPYRQDLRRVEYGDERIPEVRAWMERTAPSANAHRIRKPLLVGQGLNDPRVPHTEAEQIVAAVRGNGGEVWYVLARDEGHGFVRKSNREVWTDVTTLFLQRCLDR